MKHRAPEKLGFGCKQFWQVFNPITLKLCRVLAILFNPVALKMAKTP